VPIENLQRAKLRHNFVIFAAQISSGLIGPAIPLIQCTTTTPQDVASRMQIPKEREGTASSPKKAAEMLAQLRVDEGFTATTIGYLFANVNLLTRFRSRDNEKR
jgi:hypothetical protein